MRYGTSPNAVQHKSMQLDHSRQESYNPYSAQEAQNKFTSSGVVQSSHLEKIVHFYESIILKMSEEMQKLLINKCPLLLIQLY